MIIRELVISHAFNQKANRAISDVQCSIVGNEFKGIVVLWHHGCVESTIHPPLSTRHTSSKTVATRTQHRKKPVFSRIQR